MTPEFASVRCGSCGASISPLLAPEVRVWESRALFFCCRAHAESYQNDVQGVAASDHERPAPMAGVPDAPKTANEAASAFSVRSEPDPAAQGQRAPRSQRPNGPPDGSLPARAKPLSAPQTGASTKVASIVEPWELLPLLPLTLAGALIVTQDLGIIDAIVAFFLSGLVLFFGRRYAAQTSFRAENHLAALRARMSAEGRTVKDGRRSWTSADDLVPGEEIEVLAGEIIPADGVVVQGIGTTELYEPEGVDGAELTVQPTSVVIGGRRLKSGGPLRIVANRTGRDRAFALPLQSGKGSIIDDYSAVRNGRWLALGFAPVLAIAFGLLALAIHAPWPRAFMISASTWLVWSSPIIYRALRERIGWALVQASERGIIYSRASVLEAAGHVGTAVFCMRGTLLKGEPVVSEIHAFRDVPRERVLALAVGALRNVHHPAAHATAALAQQMGVSPEPCRSHTVGVGASVRCLNRDGAEVLVGGREFLLKYKISIAWTEERLRAIEGEAQNALVVAEDGHAIGILALSDELAGGARATMQALMGRGIEPALLSSGSRDTLEAVAQRLGVDHVRAESPERREEVERLRSAGVPVAVIGRLGVDDRALSGADVPIVFGGINSFSSTFSPRDERRSVSVYGSHLPNSAQAIVIAHALRRLSFETLLAHSIPAALGSLAAALEVVPIATLPGLSLVGLLIAQRLADRSIPMTTARDS